MNWIGVGVRWMVSGGVTLMSTAAVADVGDQLFKLLADDGAYEDIFGTSVAISGDIAIVGATRDDDNGENSGSAYLFDVRTGEQNAKLLPEDGAPLDRFGNAVAISGSLAIVGAERDNNDNGDSSGAAYLFDVSTGAQLAKVLPSDGQAGDRFGTSVALSGTVAIVGAKWDDDLGKYSGSAYSFDVSEPTRPIELDKFLPSDGEFALQFGISVGVSGDRAIVGALLAKDDINQGAAYLFDLNTGDEIHKLSPNDGGPGQSFGLSVALSGETAIVGARYDGQNGDEAGAAYLFDVVSGTQVAKLLAVDGEFDNELGSSVAISGTTAVVGASHDYENGFLGGSAYVFDTTTGEHVAKLLATDGASHDFFGERVGVDNGVAVVGSTGADNDKGIGTGAAYVFVAALCSADVNGDGNINVLDFVAFQLLWQAGDPGADCDANAEFNVVDFVCYQQLFVDGCP